MTIALISFSLGAGTMWAWFRFNRLIRTRQEWESATAKGETHKEYRDLCR